MDIGIYKNYADVIFHKLFLVTVPVLATYTEEEIELTGIRMNQEEDKNFENHMATTTVMITINDMVEKYNNGFPIRVCKYEDIVYIYEVIQAHLLAWKNRGVNSINQIRININDDLILLDKFANEIFIGQKKLIVDSNMVVKPTFKHELSSILMSPTTPKKDIGTINYEEVTRTELAPKRIRSEKYDLNTLLN